MTISVVLKFLNLHRQLQEAAVRKNAVKYLIILSEHDDPDKEEILEEVCGHISIDRKNLFGAIKERIHRSFLYRNFTQFGCGNQRRKCENFASRHQESLQQNYHTG